MMTLAPDTKILCVKGDGNQKRLPWWQSVLAASSVGMRHFFMKEEIMEHRIAVVSIIVEDTASVEPLNSCLHEYGNYIIGRMGLPYLVEDRRIHIISIAVDAPQDVIAALSGRIGKLPGVSVKTASSNITHHGA